MSDATIARGERPSPRTTLVILLGAHHWPDYSQLKGSDAFSIAAGEIRRYFLGPSCFGLPSENWLDLFDQHQSSPDEVDRTITAFLSQRIAAMKQTGIPARDLLFYYIGHGIFDEAQRYHLAILSTREESIGASAVAMASLAHTLKTQARSLRRIVVLDSCFSAQSSSYLAQAPSTKMAQFQVHSEFAENSQGKGFPRCGTALLCSSGQQDLSFLLSDESGTMFSKALIQALHQGDATQESKTHLSLQDLRHLTIEALDEQANGKAPMPFIDDPDQHTGLVTQVPFFPNFPAMKRTSPIHGAPSDPTTQQHDQDINEKKSVPLTERERARQEQEQAEKLETEMARSSKLPPLRVKRVKRSSSRRIVLVGLAGLVIVALIRGVVWFTAHQAPLTRGIQAPLAGRITSGANATTTVQATSGIPGKTWHTQIVGPPNPLSSVAWSGSQFVVVGDKGAILTSPDGHTWTAQNSGTTNELNDVVWSDSQFVVVGDGTILTSPDGHTWTVQKSDIADVLYGVAWSGKQFVVDSFSGTILTSPDGHTWTVQNSGTTEILDGVAWSGKQFVVVGENGIILTSPDGHTWTLQNSGTSLDLSGVAWSGKQFVVVDEGGDVLTSPDGHTWRSQSSGVTSWLGDVARSGSQFIVVGAAGTILTSPDGRTWTPQNSGTTNDLNGVAWSGSRFVVVGATGTILTSP